MTLVRLGHILSPHHLGAVPLSPRAMINWYLCNKGPGHATTYHSLGESSASIVDGTSDRFVGVVARLSTIGHLYIRLDFPGLSSPLRASQQCL
ncbi:hypothetical protein H9L39_09147 [Fusarium oxysporum f. sp. albedinis]|nr:hypothetical protein H9L39_09147 [Fusarium oxysporum f. sp. albedinis]